MQIHVSCEHCGHAWISSAASGQTTCPECLRRLYIPKRARELAEQYGPATLHYDPRAGTLKKVS